MAGKTSARIMSTAEPSSARTRALRRRIMPVELKILEREVRFLARRGR